MLRFTYPAWSKLLTLLELAKEHISGKEISGFGRVEVLPNGKGFLCTDVDLPRQEASGAHTDIDGHDYLEWQQDKFGLKEGMTKKEIEAANAEMQLWKLWWHSHGKMGASYSNTDNETIQDLAEYVGGWFLGLVVKEDLSDIGIYIAHGYPVKSMAKIGDGRLLPVPPEQENLKELEDLFEERVTEKVQVYGTPGSGRSVQVFQGGRGQSTPPFQEKQGKGKKKGKRNKGRSSDSAISTTDGERDVRLPSGATGVVELSSGALSYAQINQTWNEFLFASGLSQQEVLLMYPKEEGDRSPFIQVSDVPGMSVHEKSPEGKLEIMHRMNRLLFVSTTS